MNTANHKAKQFIGNRENEAFQLITFERIFKEIPQELHVSAQTFYAFLFFTVFSLFMNAQTYDCQSPHPDYTALIEFYNAFNGPSWDNNDGWSQGAAGTNCNPCGSLAAGTSPWYGVNCRFNGSGNALGDITVYNISMPNNNLSGTFPNGSWNTSDPIVLNLGYNSIQGFSTCSSDKIVNLTLNNNLISQIPTNFDLLFPNVSRLNLSTNNINGSVLDNLEMLPLITLDISHNFVSGSIPTSNNWELHSGIFNNNSITGEIPNNLITSRDGFFNSVLDMSDNQFYGSLPNDIGDFGGLQSQFHALVNFENNNLTGGIPEGYGDEPFLRLNIRNNYLTGCFDGNLLNTPSLGDNPTTSVAACPMIPRGECNINTGNCFDANWTNFQDNGEGQCGTYSCSDQQYVFYFIDELITLYNTTDGPNWNNQQGWIEGVIGLSCNVCCWYGIECDQSNTFVTSIDLSDNGLSGLLPSELAQIPSLLSLDVSNNLLEGALPGTYGNLANLLYLNISNNDLGGCFDSNLSSLCAIANNDHVSKGNSFEQFWEQFCDYSTLGCANPEITTLLSLYTATDGANWTNNDGWVDGAAGTNCDPCGLACDTDPWYGVTCNNLFQVTKVELEANNLTGPLPNTLHQLTSLTDLLLAGNNITGPIPPDLGTAGIDRISLANNGLSGEIPANLSSSNLLILSDNDLTGDIPPAFGTSTTLQGLIINNNDLCGCYDLDLTGLCTSLGGFGNNANISDGNNFNATWEGFCDGLGTCDFEGLDCYHPDVAALDDLFMSTGGDSWTNNDGWMEDCDPCGECDGTPWFGVTCVNNRVTELSIFNNNLVGPLPSSLIGLTELGILRLYGNSLSGELPPEYGTFSNLTDFHLGGNNLTGSIPDEYCDMTQLSLFVVASNQLSGCFDDDLTCLCTITNSIDMGNNFSLPFSGFCVTGDGSCSDNCIDLDGVNDYLLNTTLATTADFTVMARFMVGNTSSGSTEDRIFSFGPTTRLEVGIFDGGANDGRLWLFDSQGGSSQVYGSSLRDMAWHHVAITKNASSLSIYLDGVLLNSQVSTAGTLYGPQAAIGDWTGSALGTYFNGQIDDVSIWNYAMGATDITTALSCEPTGTELELIAAYDFNDIGESAANNTILLTTGIPDISGNGNIMTISGMTMNGPTSNLVFSTTGVSDDCTFCLSPPIVNCKQNLIFSFDPLTDQLIVDVTDIDDGSSSVCGTISSLSFDPNSIETTLNFDCPDEIGQHQIELFVNDSNGLQSSCTTTIEIESNNPDLLALQDFYLSTKGDMWTNNTGWLTNCDPCGMQVGNDEWFGLNCGNNRVESIFLIDNNLDGVLPASINTFTEITQFVVNNNSITGPFPDICNWANLQSFAVGNNSSGNNSFSGPLPSCLNTFENLTAVYVQGNMFDGDIPNFNPITQPNLIEFRASGNKLTGSIPSNYGDFSWADLELHNNMLSGCFDPGLSTLCNNVSIDNSNATMSDGNSFSMDWEDFCINGGCCDMDLTLSGDVVSGTYTSANTITVTGNIPAGVNVTFDAPVVIFDPVYTVSGMATVTVENNGCMQ